MRWLVWPLPLHWRFPTFLSKPRPAYPDFYRLRLNNQLINFSIDSTETVSFVADAETFATSYTVEGSENGKAIKNITLAQLDANQLIQRLRKAYEAGEVSDTLYAEEVKKAAKAYKEVALQYIYSAPMSPAAYFALFQQIDGLLFFDLYDPADSKASAASTRIPMLFPVAVIRRSRPPRLSKNSGAQSVRIFRLLGGSHRRNSTVGDIVMCAVKKAIPNAKVKKGDVVKGVIVRVKKAYQKSRHQY